MSPANQQPYRLTLPVPAERAGQTPYLAIAFSDLRPRRVAPEILQAVKGPLLCMKNVHQHVVIIDDDPLAHPGAVRVVRLGRVVIPQALAHPASSTTSYSSLQSRR